MIDVFELSEILDTFSIICDTREQATPKAKERFAAFGVPVQRATLHYGDYCANVQLPGGKWLYDIRHTISPACSLERK